MTTNRKVDTCRAYWYKYFWGNCPVCGKDKSYKKRQYTPKPERATDRHEVLSEAVCYDWCNVL